MTVGNLMFLGIQDFWFNLINFAQISIQFCPNPTKLPKSNQFCPNFFC